MSFVWEQLQQLGMVAIIMICAVGGTVGILKLIKCFAPGKDFPKDPVAKKLEESSRKLNEED